ncbi:MAG: phosphotransferase [Nannocystaceae bacterium]|nr:phosphotransferase [Nannocystaceae bacterium]
MSLLRTLVSSSRALITGAREVARFQEIARVFIRHGFGWAYRQLKLRRELEVEFEGRELTQATLASPDTGKRLVAAFNELGPTFVKLGQILSTRTDLLPDSITSELATLQDSVTPVAFADIESQLVKELGNDWRSKFEEFDEEPLASASIAQVHRATLEGGRKVVLKVQRPGVKPKITGDLGVLHALAGWLEEAIPEAAAMDLRGTITSFTKSILQELDFRIEARNLERFRSTHEDNTQVVFPAVYDELSTEEVLCMEFLEGRSFAHAIDEGEDVSAVAETYFKVAYKMLFIDGFFHGDLHPGNVLVMDDQRLGVLDCGMVGRLSPAMKDKVIDILHAVLNEDLEGVARTFYDLSIRTDLVDYPRFEADVIDLGERYLSGLPMSEVQIGMLFSEIVTGASRHNVRMPTDFTMMFKAIITTEGMAKMIAPQTDPIELARPYIMQMVADRYSPDRIKQMAVRDFSMFSRLARSMPHSIPGVIEDLRAGKLTFRTNVETLDRQERSANARTARSVRTALTVTCLVCGTYTMGLGLPIWGLVGIPVITAIFFVFAGVGLFTVIWR